MTKMEFGDIAVGNRDEYEKARSKFFKSKEDTFIVIPELKDVKTPHGNGVFRVRDTMNKRYSGQGRLDIFIPFEEKEINKKVRQTPTGTYFYK